MRRALAWCAVAATLALAPRPAGARPYPWVPLGDDVRVIADPRVEHHLRLALIARARRTIDIVNYDQRADEAVALPLATALRAAAERGVRVRFVVSWNSTVLFDFQNRFGELLVDPPTRAPIEYLVMGGPEAQDHGWGLFEGVHEKLFIVDGAELVTTGRGIGEQYLWWLDTAFALRGPLVAQAADAFADVWRRASAVTPAYRGYLGGATQRRPRAYPSGEDTKLDARGQREVDALAAWLTERPRAPGSDRARLLHHDFLRQIRALDPTPVDVALQARLDRLKDPVIDALVDRLATAREVRMAFISTILHPTLRRALIAARRRGATVTLFVNTAAPRLGRSRKPIVPGGGLWSMELPDLDELLQAGVRVLAFQIRDGSPWLFLHRKLAVIDDTVIFGSHNFNVPSTAYFDEASFEARSPRLAAELGRVFDADAARNGVALDPAWVHREHERQGPRLLRWLSRPYLGYM